MRFGLLGCSLVCLAACGAPSPSRSPSRVRSAAALPPGWVIVAPPKPDSREAHCANWADTGWAVALTPDSGQLVISPAHHLRRHTLEVSGGRLGADNRGEFGGTIWWQPTGGPTITLSEGNLVDFVQLGSQVLGLEGLGGYGPGRLLKFTRRASDWRVDTLVQLGDAPYAYTVVLPDSIFVATTSTLLLIRDTVVRRLYHSAVWYLTYANSVARDQAGWIYVGMQSAVARLTSTDSGYQERWIVPASCPRRRLVPRQLDRCVCVPPS